MIVQIYNCYQTWGGYVDGSYDIHKNTLFFISLVKCKNLYPRPLSFFLLL